MCWMCDESPLGYVTCQNCGRMICCDTEGIDDITASAYVTEAGDLYCLPCGKRIDEENRELDELEFGWMWENYPGDLLAENDDFAG